MVAFVLSIALALVSHHATHAAHPAVSARGALATAEIAHARSSTHFPVRGIVVPGVSFAGLKLGQTEQQVAALWGKNYTVCTYCKDPTWLYVYPGGEPLGAGVRFQKNKIVAVFSLGSPAGWRTDKGLFMGDPISNVYNYFGTTGTTRCIGFDALTVRLGNSTTAFYSAAGVIYGFAIVAGNLSVCQ
jgi:hypothetical protein